MILMKDIIREGDERLHEKSKDVSVPVSKEDINLLKEMMEYVRNSVDEAVSKKYNLRPSVGLACPQLGILKRIIAISAENEVGELVELAIMNPKIISYSEELAYLDSGEGCLSVDREVKGLVFRHKKIKFKALVLENDKMVERIISLKGYLAIVFQHEYDHLEGILFPDRINKQDPFFVPENAKRIVFKGEEESVK